MENITTTQPEVKKLPAKYEKLALFSYWIQQQIMLNTELTFDTVVPIYQSINTQIEFMDNFFQDYNIIKKNYKTELRNIKKKNNKMLELQKIKEPKIHKKRGRKKKEIIDTRTPEEKLIDEIIANAQL
jgi:hypothetical protein